jgi:hypothetical protein
MTPPQAAGLSSVRVAEVCCPSHRIIQILLVICPIIEFYFLTYCKKYSNLQLQNEETIFCFGGKPVSGALVHTLTIFIHRT